MSRRPPPEPTPTRLVLAALGFALALWAAWHAGLWLAVGIVGLLTAGAALWGHADG